MTTTNCQNTIGTDTTAMTDSNRTIARKRMVQFATSSDQDENNTTTVLTKIVEIPNRESFTEEDYSNLWFTKHDYNINKLECQLVSRDSIRYGYNKILSNVFDEKNDMALQNLQSWSSAPMIPIQMPTSTTGSSIVSIPSSVVSSPVSSPSASSSSLCSSCSDSTSSCSSSTEEFQETTMPTTPTLTPTTPTLTPTAPTLTPTTPTLTPTTTTLTPKTPRITSQTPTAPTSQTPSRQTSSSTKTSSSSTVQTVSTRRGLERWCNRDHGEQRKTLQFQAIMAVLEAQDEMLQKTNGYIDIDRLRKVSYKSTKVARHFARMMGKADSYAVAHMNDDDVENMDTIAQSQAKKLSNDETGATITTVATSDSITIDNDCYSIGDNDSLLMIPRVDEIDDLVSTSSNTHNFNDSMSSIASPTTPTRSLFHSTTKSKSKTPSAFRRFRFSSRRKLKEEDASSSSPPQQPDAEVL